MIKTINKLKGGLRVLVGLCLWLSVVPGSAQPDIPVGTWRFHLSYNDIHSLEITPETVFAASESGIVAYSRHDQRLTTYNKLNGLSGSGIASLKFDDTTRQLLIGYLDGNLDIISEATISTFSRLREADVTSSRKINDISTRGDIAYLSTAFGVVLFDLKKLEIRETWRDLGPDGETLPVYSAVFLQDTIYLATGEGVLAGNLTDNLLDFNNWKRYGAGSFAGQVRSIAVFNDKVYTAGAAGVYRLEKGSWFQEPFLQSVTIASLSASADNLMLIAGSTVYYMNASGDLTALSDELIRLPLAVSQDDGGSFWVGDGSAGLVSNTGGTFTSWLPNGPTITDAYRMVYRDGQLFALEGRPSVSGETSNIPGDLNVFENGNWHSIRQPASSLTDIAFQNGSTFVSSFGSGLLVTNASGDTSRLNETNSPLRNSAGDGSYIPALVSSADGLWVANHGGNEPLHLLRNDGSWDSFAFSLPNENSPIDVALDGLGNVWMALNPASGGGLVVLERARNQGVNISNVAGNGALPDKNVQCIAADMDGYIWVGTDAGVAYFFSPTADAIKPIYENRFLLRDEKITAIETDAGNRKWIGTERGVWLFDVTGENHVHHFTRDNSPLISDVIRDIEIHEGTGEVFFATDLGIVSYRSDAVMATQKAADLKIFPNPVHPGYSGVVGITGLPENAFVRITDISGKLIWQTVANGGMATWNARDTEGRRAPTGVYLVFATNRDGSESIVGKIAVIE